MDLMDAQGIDKNAAGMAPVVIPPAPLVNYPPPPDPDPYGGRMRPAALEELPGIPVGKSKVVAASTVPGPLPPVYDPGPYRRDSGASNRLGPEIEWAKQAISTHHESIKQLQLVVGSLQSSLDAANEAIARLDSAPLASRVASLTQQFVELQDTQNQMKRMMNEQVNSLSQQVIAVSAREPAENKFEKPDVTDTPVKKSPRGTRRVNLLPPLPVQVTRPVISFPEPPTVTADAAPKPATPPKTFVTDPRFVISNTYFSVDSGTAASHIVSRVRDKGVRIDKMEPVDTEPSPIIIAAVPGGGGFAPPVVSSPAKRDDDVPPDDRRPSGRSGGSELISVTSMRFPQRSLVPDQPQALSEDMEDRITIMARKVTTLVADHAKSEMKHQTVQMEKAVEKVMSVLDQKIDRDFVERMFNKFRVMLSDINEKVDNIQCSFLEWVTRDELETVLQRFAGIVADVRDSAAARTSNYDCLLCGRPRSHVAGMVIKEHMPPIADSRPRTAVLNPKSRKKPPPLLTNSPIVTEREATPALQPPPRDVVELLTTPSPSG
jgi:hypothetical protein